jgi:hypothetical protein
VGLRLPKRIVLFGIVAGALGAGGFPPSVVARTEDCRTRGRTVEANGQVRVFVRVTEEGGVRIYYACDLVRRKAHGLGMWERGQGGLSLHFGLAGRRVVYEDILCDDPTQSCNGNVVLMDVRSGRIRFVAQFPGPQEAPPATDLLLAPNGTVVWIRPDGARGANGLFGPPVVSKVGPDRQLIVLDPGPGVEAGSLANAGNRFYWTRGGVAQSFVAG